MAAPKSAQLFTNMITDVKLNRSIKYLMNSYANLLYSRFFVSRCYSDNYVISLRVEARKNKQKMPSHGSGGNVIFGG